jgi:hypothetical protein
MNRFLKKASTVPPQAQLLEKLDAFERRIAALENDGADNLPRDALVVDRSLAELSRRVNDGRPNINYMTMRFRDYETLARNVKMLTRYVTRELLEGEWDVGPASVSRTRLNSKICTQADMESSWLGFWRRALGLAPQYHRKTWEFCYIAQALFAEGKLSDGESGLGFGCGDEPLPSLFAHFGAEIRATDMEPNRMVSAGWVASGAIQGTLANIYHPHICPDPEKLARIKIGHVDMNDIPEALYENFTFCWSAGALAHLGSIAAGLAFVENSLKVLKPGGVAVHTTEFNLVDSGDTIDDWPTVLFQRKHLTELAQKLGGAGFEVATFDFDVGNGVLDGLVDLPPFEDGPAERYGRAPHLRISIDGIPSTSVGMIIRKPPFNLPTNMSSAMEFTNPDQTSGLLKRPTPTKVKSSMISRTDVEQAFRFILGREPDGSRRAARWWTRLYRPLIPSRNCGAGSSFPANSAKSMQAPVKASRAIRWRGNTWWLRSRCPRTILTPLYGTSRKTGNCSASPICIGRSLPMIGIGRRTLLRTWTRSTSLGRAPAKCLFRLSTCPTLMCIFL